MEKIKSSIAIDAPVEKVFGYLLNPMNQVDWMPSMIEVFDLTGTNVGDTHRWKYKMSGIMLEGITTFEELVPNKRLGTRTKGGVTSYFLFVLKPQNGGTIAELNIEYTVPVPVLGKLAEKAILKRNKREADMSMQNIKEILEN